MSITKLVEPVVLPSRLSTVLPCPEVPIPSNFDALPILSRSTIASKIAAGNLLVIHSPLVYRIPVAWLKLHPGGDLAILHYVGREASNELEAYHSGRTVKERMSRWIIGKIEVDEKNGWRDMVPPVQLGMWPLPVPIIKVSTAEEVEGNLVEKVGLTGGIKTEAPPCVLTATMVNPTVSSSTPLPLTPSYQHHLRKSARKLHARIQSLGLDSPPPFMSGYGPSTVIYVSLFFLFVYLYQRAVSTLDYIAAAVALGCWWHQITFVVHDAAHTALTGNWWRDRVVGILIGDFLGGISVGWWNYNHNTHHLVTNSPEHDPDIQHMPFIAISDKFFASLRSTYYDRVMKFDRFTQFILPYQHNLYYLLMCFGRFNLFANSYQFIWTKWPSRASPLFNLRLLELVGIAFYWTWFTLLVKAIPGNGTKIMFVLISFAVTSPLHVQIVLSHFSQPVSVDSEIVQHAELIESHAHRQLRTTMDISCPTYLDFLHGGLNFQVSHHLLPRTPRFNFRAVAKEVDAWAKNEQDLVKDGTWMGEKLKPNEGLVYKKMQFVEANRSVLGVLKNVAQQANLLLEVAKADAKGELHH